MSLRLHGLTAATHTPFDSTGALDLSVVEKQAERLVRSRVAFAFVGGTTGESHSLAVDERLALAERWCAVVRGSTLRVVVHVGANCLADSRTLAAQAQRLGAAATSALAPSYFKPRSVETLVACCAEIAGAAPELPFYYYDIPSMTGVALSTPELLAAAADRIPNLAGAKFTNADQAAYQKCLALRDGRFDVPWGIDEVLLAALALGARGAVGSTYNFAAPLYHRVLDAFERGDWEAARREQLRAVRLVDLLASYGYMGAAKTVMELLGVPVGPPRLPNAALPADRRPRLRDDLERLGFFEWIGEAPRG